MGSAADGVTARLQTLDLAEHIPRAKAGASFTCQSGCSPQVDEPIKGTGTGTAQSEQISDEEAVTCCLEVKQSPGKGAGIFATRKIVAGTCVLTERPLIILDRPEEDDPEAIEREFRKLSKAGQRQYLRLFDAEKSRLTRVVSIYYSNCYNCDGSKEHGGSAVGAMSSRINHSCVPNVQFSYDEARRVMTFYAIRNIPRGKEIFSNYDKAVFETAAKRMRKQRLYYGFVCDCEACRPQTDFWVRSDDRRRAMGEATRELKELEINYEAGHREDVRTALDTLARLEGLLMREGLVGLALANTYRSMAKWAERMGDMDEVWKCKSREKKVYVLCFGPEAPRVKDIDVRLAQLKVQG